MTSGMYQRTEEHKQKIRDGLKGYVPKNLSWLHEFVKGQKRESVTGANNYAWKGDSVSYRSLHTWVERNLGKANCCSNDLLHEATRYHWANISGEYKRELSDWKQLCPKCHSEFDRARN